MATYLQKPGRLAISMANGWYNKIKNAENEDEAKMVLSYAFQHFGRCIVVYIDNDIDWGNDNEWSEVEDDLNKLVIKV